MKVCKKCKEPREEDDYGVCRNGRPFVVCEFCKGVVAAREARGYKLCSGKAGCGREFPATLEFFFPIKTRGTISSHCRSCLKERAKKYHDPEDVSAKYFARKAADPEWYVQKNRGSQLRRYGLTISDYHRMVERQGGKCALCPATDPRSKSKGAWAVDHEHVDGWEDLSPKDRKRYVRGLVCHPCNLRLGYLEKIDSDSSWEIRARRYLEGGGGGD